MNKRDFIADDILSKIYQNKYKTGEKMPTERELAVQYEVSRYTIREALKKLVNIGCIKIVQGSGIFVNESRYRSPLIYNSLTEKKFKDIQSKIIYLKKIKPDKNLEQIFDISGDDKNYGNINGYALLTIKKCKLKPQDCLTPTFLI